MPGKEFWNERYGSEDYVYGIEPNEFFRQQLDLLNPGTILLPAEGEGRNAVYAASRGWKVECFDQSEKGREKALRLSADKGVSIHYGISSIEEFTTGKTYDAIALIYAHLPPILREGFHSSLVELLNPGGTLILEGYSKDQLGRNSGGPQDIRMLYSIEELEEDFSEMSELSIENEEVQLKEGPFHQGMANVIRVVGKK